MGSGIGSTRIVSSQKSRNGPPTCRHFHKTQEFRIVAFSYVRARLLPTISALLGGTAKEDGQVSPKARVKLCFVGFTGAQITLTAFRQQDNLSVEKTR